MLNITKRAQRGSLLFLILVFTLLMACRGGGGAGGVGGGDSEAAAPAQNATDDLLGTEQAACLAANYPSLEWTQCETANFANVGVAPIEQAASPEFLTRLQLQSVQNLSEFLLRSVTDLFWLSVENLCATWGEQCAGDPYRYPGVDPWYETIGTVTPVNFYDAEGARLSGRVWAPKNPPRGKRYPGISITNGSVQAPEPLYWWAAQLLVQNGYVVLTFDPRAQGRSDSRTPAGAGGSNLNPVVFRRNTIDAIEFFFSTPSEPYAHNLADAPGPRGDNGLAETTPYNPIWQLLDRDRFGIAGHSLGATGVSVVQGEQPWPGPSMANNPVKAVVAWDNLALEDNLDGVAVKPRVPAMGQSGDYFLAPTPYLSPPDVNEKAEGFDLWQDADVPSMQVNIRGAAHYEWSLLPTFPASSWEWGKIISPDGSDIGTGWAQPVAQYYTLAWFDRWLKEEGEPGYEDADERLLNDRLFRDRLSFHFLSKRDFRDRDGRRHRCEDMARGC